MSPIFSLIIDNKQLALYFKSSLYFPSNFNVPYYAAFEIEALDSRATKRHRRPQPFRGVSRTHRQGNAESITKKHRYGDGWKMLCLKIHGCQTPATNS